MRPRADAKIVAEAPVIKIVPAFLPGQRIRGGLVMPIAGCGKALLDHFIDVGGGVLIGQLGSITMK